MLRIFFSFFFLGGESLFSISVRSEEYVRVVCLGTPLKSSAERKIGREIFLFYVFDIDSWKLTLLNNRPYL